MKIEKTKDGDIIIINDDADYIEELIGYNVSIAENGRAEESQQLQKDPTEMKDISTTSAFKIYINGQMVDPNKDNITLIFYDTQAKNEVCHHLMNMPERVGIRMANYRPKDSQSFEDAEKMFDEIEKILTPWQ